MTISVAFRFGFVHILSQPERNFKCCENVAEPMMTPYDTGETKEIPDHQTSSVSEATKRPSQVEADFVNALRWIGDDPAREGLIARLSAWSAHGKNFASATTKVASMPSVPLKRSKAMMTW